MRQEVARLRVPLSKPQRHITVDGQRVELSPEQYADLVQRTGKPAKQYLNEFIRSDEWRSMPDDARVELVRDTLGEFREAGREALKKRYPAGLMRLRVRSLSHLSHCRLCHRGSRWSSARLTGALNSQSSADAKMNEPALDNSISGLFSATPNHLTLSFLRRP